jgi:hypothetical protein
MDITSCEKTPLLEAHWLWRVFERYGLQSLCDNPRSPLFSPGTFSPPEKRSQFSPEGTAESSPGRSPGFIQHLSKVPKGRLNVAQDARPGHSEQLRGIEFASMVLTHTHVCNSFKTDQALAAGGNDPDVYPGPGPDPGHDPEPVPLPPPDPDPGLPLDPLPTPAPVY